MHKMKYERHHIADIIIDDEQASKDGREVSVFVDTHEQVNIEIGTSLVIRTGYQGLHSLRHILDDASAKLDQKLKKLRRSEQQTVDVWNPNDPSNW